MSNICPHQTTTSLFLNNYFALFLQANHRRFSSWNLNIVYVYLSWNLHIVYVHLSWNLHILFICGFKLKFALSIYANVLFLILVWWEMKLQWEKTEFHQRMVGFGPVTVILLAPESGALGRLAFRGQVMNQNVRCAHSNVEIVLVHLSMVELSAKVQNIYFSLDLEKISSTWTQNFWKKISDLPIFFWSSKQDLEFIFCWHCKSYKNIIQRDSN